MMMMMAAVTAVMVAMMMVPMIITIILLIKMMVMSHVIGNGVMIFVMETLRSSHIRMQASWSINVVCQESCRLLSHPDKKPEPQAC